MNARRIETEPGSDTATSWRWLLRVSGLVMALVLATGYGQVRAQGPTEIQPAAPQLVAPADGEVTTGITNPPVGMPTLTWEATAGATKYNVQISASAGFANPAVNIATTATSYTPVQALADGDYYWRVRAYVDNAWGAYAEPRSFHKDWSAAGALAPVLTAPLDGSELAAFDHEHFGWQPVSGAAAYLLEISTDQSFSTPIYSVTTLKAHHTPLKRLGNNTYYWRVTPIDNRNNRGMASDVWSFTFAWDEAPQPLAPDDNVDLPFLPSFSWSAVQAAKSYVLQISTQPDFAAANQYLTANTAFMPEKALSNDQDYYWRVKAVDAEGTSSPWSTPRQYRMRWNFQPHLLTPLNNSLQQAYPFFTWTPVPGIERYQLQIDASTAFLSPIADVKLYNATSYAQPEWQVALQEQDYFWRVRGIDAQDNLTPWSTVYSFRVSHTTTSNLVYPLYYSAPDADSLPVHEDHTVAWPLFVWDTAHSFVPTALDQPLQLEAPAYYSLTVASDPGFQTVVFQVETAGLAAAPTLAQPFVGLADGHVYAWRVRAIRQDGSQLGADMVWQARIDRTVPQIAATTVISVMYPSDGAEAVGTAPVLGWQPVQGADHYRVQLSRERDFAAIVDEAQPQFVNYAPWQGRRSHIPFGTFWWRVRAEDAAGQALGDWSSGRHFNVSQNVMMGNPNDFVPPLPPASILEANTHYSPTFTLVSQSPANPGDPYDLGALHVMLDRVYTGNFNWVIAFGASANVTGTVLYGIYLDIDHRDHAGATSDPLGKPIQVDALHLPDYALYVTRVGDSVDETHVDFYRWTGTSWTAAQSLAATGGQAWYAPASQAVQLLIPYTAIGASADDFVGSVALTVFSTSLSSADGVQDSVPPQAPLLSTPAFVSDMLTPLYPFDTPLNNPLVFYEMPALRWRMPYFGSIDGYQLELARDARFTDLVETWETFESKTSAYFGLLPTAFHTLNALGDNESYYWRVRIRHERFTAQQSDFDYGPWSPAQRFKLSSRLPGQPTVSTGDLAHTTPTFRWARVEGAAGYRLQVDKDANFSKPLLDKLLDGTSYTPLEALPDGSYFWRVAIRRSDKVFGQWTPVLTFTKQSLAPAPVGPNAGQVINQQPTFRWLAILTNTATLHAAAPQYQVQWDDDPNFSSPQTRKTEATSYTTIKGESLGDGSWYWRVATLDASGHVGAYSPVQQFYKEYLSPPLLYPLQGITQTITQTQGLYFEWTPLAGAAYYKVEIADNGTFNKSTTTSTDNTRYTPSLEIGKGQPAWTEIYWRVQMVDRDNKPGPFELGRVSPPSDPPANATLAIDDVSRGEGNTGTTLYTFTVTLSGTVDSGFTVDYATADGSAQASQDYTARNGTLTFAGNAGEQQQIAIAVAGDTRVEANETFSVTLSNVQANGRNISLGDTTGTATIQNDDRAMLAIDDVSHSEGNTGTTLYTFTVRLDRAVDSGFTVDYATADGSAQAPQDYTARNGTLTFAGNAGEQRPIVIAVAGDILGETNETFSVVLSNVQANGRNVSLGHATGTATIQNDDSYQGSVAVSKTANVTEANLGDTIIYTYRITNTGASRLHGFIALDDRLGVINPLPASLATGESAGATLSHIVTPGDLPGPLVNTVVVTGLLPDNLPVRAEAQTSVALLDVAFIFRETVGIAGITPACTGLNNEHLPAGTTVVYCYTIQNQGTATLALHTLVDSHLGTLLNQAPHDVAPGGVYAVTFTGTLTVSTTNVATWTASVSDAAHAALQSAGTVGQTSATVIVSGPDDDQDGDTIPDNVETADDVDGDNLPNFRDTDADGDGLPDQAEAGADPHHPIDSDSDGIPDTLQPSRPSARKQLYLPLVIGP